MNYIAVVQMLVNFNGVQVATIGLAMKKVGDCFLVDFSHDGVDFRGLWPQSNCTHCIY